MKVWPQCCESTHVQVAVVTATFMETPEPWQVEFVKANYGKCVCFDCGGEVTGYRAKGPDHVTATATTRRLRKLGIL